MHVVEVQQNVRPALTAKPFPETEASTRLGELDDVRLGEALMALCRKARAFHADRMSRSTPLLDTATTAFFFDIVPEIASRLGCLAKAPEEGRPDIETLADGELAFFLESVSEMVPSFPCHDARSAADPWALLRSGTVENAMTRLLLRAAVPASARAS